MRTLRKVVIAGICCCGLLVPAVSSWAQEYIPTPQSVGAESAPWVAIRNAKQPFPGILTGGQPTDEQLMLAAKAGIKTVINLRSEREMSGLNEVGKVTLLKMNYLSIPVDGAAGVSEKNSQRLAEALSNPELYPVMVHCASGNRVGALFALDANKRLGLSKDEALAVGKRAGLTSLELLVKGMLD